MKYNNSILYKKNPSRWEVSVNIVDLPLYSIAGRCTCGSRHYSEMLTYENALAIMPKYVGVVDYFGGGVVELLDNEGNILKRCTVR